MAKPNSKSGGKTFGAALRKARQRRGVSIQDISRATRVVSRYLQALENETIDTLPGGAYNRAYLRMYADYLKLDAAELLRQYDDFVQARSGQSGDGSDAVTVMRAAAQHRVSRPASRRRVVALVAGVIALSAAVAALGLSFRTEWLTRAYWSGSRPDIGTIRQSVRRFAEPPLQAEVIVPAALRVAPLAPPALSAATLSEAPSGIATDTATPTAVAGAATASQSVVPDSAGEPASAPGLSVSRAGVGTDVVERQLVGESDRFPPGSTVVFWTLVAGGHAGDAVRHVWIHDDITVRTVELAVGSSQWRTYSRMPLDAESAGNWVVEARDRDGHLLARRTFHSPS